MADWLRSSMSGVEYTPQSPIQLGWRIGLALLLGVAVAGLYRWSKRGVEIPPTFQPTLVLLATVIAMATQIIGDNVARAFALVGALSVVRFRTVVKDTQDTAFVILAVVIGMAAGANSITVALVGLIVVGLASLAIWPRPRANAWQTPGNTLLIRVGMAPTIRNGAEAILAASANHFELIATQTTKQKTGLDLTYHVTLRAGVSPAELVAELIGFEGVEHVELERGD